MISCEKFDYIEMACMFNYTVELKLVTGHSISGIATDTVTGSEQEQLVLTDDSGTRKNVPLDQVRQLNVLSNNARFSSVSFE